MTWLLWRQHRRQGAGAAAALGALGVLLWITGESMAHTYRRAMSACTASGTCNDLKLFQNDRALFDLVDFTVLVPVLIGVFWGATVVGRELDNGTNRLVWTQSVTRRSWLRSKILLLLISSAAVGSVMSALVTWWSGTSNSLHQNRFEGLQFDSQGLAPVAYTIFAAALGLACGVLWRRTLPAIGTTIGVFVTVRFVVESFLRPHYETPVTAIGPLSPGNDSMPGAWSLDGYPILNGHRVAGGVVRLPESCAAALNRPDAASCLSKLGYADLNTYQPGGRYWTFQWIEAGIFVGFAALLVAVAVVALRRQDA